MEMVTTMSKLTERQEAQRIREIVAYSENLNYVATDTLLWHIAHHMQYLTLCGKNVQSSIRWARPYNRPLDDMNVCQQCRRLMDAALK